jgi:hypothetical protein
MGQGIMKDLHPSLVLHATFQPTQFVLFAEGSAACTSEHLLHTYYTTS